MGVAVALDQAGAFRDLAGELARELRGVADRGQPGLDLCLLLGVAMALGADAAQGRERAEAQPAGDRERVDLHAEIDAAEPALARAVADDRPGEARRQHRADLLDAGLEELDDPDGIVGAELVVGADARDARRIDLLLRDPDHVLEGHAHREVAGGLGHELSGRARLGVGFADRREAIEIEPRIARVLISREAAQAFHRDLMRRSRKRARGFGLEPGELRHRAVTALAVALRRRRDLAPGGVEAGAEAGEIGLGGLALGADRLLEHGRGNGQTAGSRDGAEHHGIDHGAARARGLLHVEQQASLGVRLDRPDEAGRIGAAVAHRGLLGHGVEARRGGDDEGAVARDEAAGDPAAGLEQLARGEEIDVADARGERQHRAAAAELGGGHRHDLDVVRGRAGALGDARNRGRLHGQAEPFGRGHDPAREHAAALAAERGDQQRDRARRAHAATSRPPSRPMTRRRSRWAKRSKRLGLRITSAR
ncbi:MAG: hypothetical protein M5U07_23370 [Xanthobacteraceae bacterium]|nr:hypothetical protein [Xanthobacteraceae bacterium]